MALLADMAGLTDATTGDRGVAPDAILTFAQDRPVSGVDAVITALLSGAGPAGAVATALTAATATPTMQSPPPHAGAGSGPTGAALTGQQAEAAAQGATAIPALAGPGSTSINPAANGASGAVMARAAAPADGASVFAAELARGARAPTSAAPPTTGAPSPTIPASLPAQTNDMPSDLAGAQTAALTSMRRATTPTAATTAEQPQAPAPAQAAPAQAAPALKASHLLQEARPEGAKAGVASGDENLRPGVAAQTALSGAPRPQNRSGGVSDAAPATAATPAAATGASASVATQAPAPAQPAQPVAETPAGAGDMADLAAVDPAAAEPLPGAPGEPRGTTASHAGAPATPHGPRWTAHTTQHLAVQMARRAESGVSSFAIRLDPAELGRIEVRLSIGADGNVRASLSVERPETLAEVMRAAGELAEALSDAGLGVEDGALSFSLDERGPRRGRPDPQDAERVPRAAAAAEVDVQSPPPPTPERWSRGRIDLTL